MSITLTPELEAAVARVRRVMNGETVGVVYCDVLGLRTDLDRWARSMAQEDHYRIDCELIAEHFIREHGKKGGDDDT